VPGSVIRFVIAGATTTLASFGLYLLLLPFMPYAAAYSAAFVAGLVLSYLLNSTFVFRASSSARTAALFPLIYLVQYLVGLAVVGLWVDALGLPDTLASVAAIVVTLPITYMLSRSLFSWRRAAPDHET
jgi:putative flippase GtrA